MLEINIENRKVIFKEKRNYKEIIHEGYFYNTTDIENAWLMWTWGFCFFDKEVGTGYAPNQEKAIAALIEYGTKFIMNYKHITF